MELRPHQLGAGGGGGRGGLGSFSFPVGGRATAGILWYRTFSSTRMPAQVPGVGAAGAWRPHHGALLVSMLPPPRVREKKAALERLLQLTPSPATALHWSSARISGPVCWLEAAKVAERHPEEKEGVRCQPLIMSTLCGPLQIRLTPDGGPEDSCRTLPGPRTHKKTRLWAAMVRLAARGLDRPTESPPLPQRPTPPSLPPPSSGASWNRASQASRYRPNPRAPGSSAPLDGRLPLEEGWPRIGTLDGPAQLAKPGTAALPESAWPPKVISRHLGAMGPCVEADAVRIAFGEGPREGGDEEPFLRPGGRGGKRGAWEGGWRWDTWTRQVFPDAFLPPTPESEGEAEGAPGALGFPQGR